MQNGGMMKGGYGFLSPSAKAEIEYYAGRVNALIDTTDDLVKALNAIGAAHTQHNLLSTATDEERRAFIDRVITAWNDYAIPALAKAEGC